ncbi:MAG: hypothetical protein A4E37_01556 [Methanoregulaceae archaeon PtaB.Bin056]|jgi:DNA-binding transcriptional regulator YhcF (GntR family)|nr:MAG: hypothetical protein A4E37_01556 [Methanoregulaceae archaeon PtaB.Bin056]
MAALSIDLLFTAAIRIFLEEERSITINCSLGEIRIKFPTTRRLAEFLQVPHYYVLPYFAMMEEMELVTRAERIGIFTTPNGTKKLVKMMCKDFRKEASEVIGEPLLAYLEARVFSH